METIVVTRHAAHAALVEYLLAEGIVPQGTSVVVVGELPLHLAAEAARVVEVPMSLPPELRGVELTVEQVRQFAGAPVEYEVRKVSK